MRKIQGRFYPFLVSDLDDERIFSLSPINRALYYEIRAIDARCGGQGRVPKFQVTRLPGYSNVWRSMKALEASGLVSVDDKHVRITDSLATDERQTNDDSTTDERQVSDNPTTTQRQPSDNLVTKSEKNARKNNEVQSLEIEIDKELEIYTPPNPPTGGSGELFEKPPDKLEGPKAAKVPTTEINQVEETFIAELQTLRKSQGRQAPRKRKLAEDERKTVAKAIKAVGVDGACAAVRGMFKTPHNLGQNDRETEYLSIAIALRPSNLDRFIGKGAQEKKPICIGDFGQPIFHDTPDADLTKTERKRKQEALQNDVAC